MSSHPLTDALMHKLFDEVAATEFGIPMQEPFEQMEELARELELALAAANERANKLEQQVEKLADELHEASDAAETAESQLAAKERELAEVREALDNFRDTILHQRGALAENGMTGDQVNDVLNEFDKAREG